nr:polysaccharide biosynthesis/export family protein [Oceaniglobus trochenteri]
MSPLWRSVTFLAICLSHFSGGAFGAVFPVIAPGDALQIDFLDDDAAPLPLDVGRDGTVQLPFVGALAIAGNDLDQARSLISELYIAREVFIAPRIELSFVSMRPLSVLGDVRQPGVYDFRPFVTVEQAIGLAGGVMRAGDSEEGRSMQRAALRGELDRIEGDLTREAVVAARLNTQLEDGQAIDPDSVKVMGLNAADRQLIDTLVVQDNGIIAAERGHFDAQKALLGRAVVDARLQIGLIQDQITAQEAQIRSYDDELKGNADLADRGLVAAPVRARLLRQVADEKTDLLRLRTNLAAARLQLVGLERQQLELDYQRRQSWRLALSDSAVRAAQLRAGRQATLDRLEVVEGWSARMSEAESQAELSYLVRRRLPDGRRMTSEAGETDELSPGDVLIVRITPAEDLAQARAGPRP